MESLRSKSLAIGNFLEPEAMFARILDEEEASCREKNRIDNQREEYISE